MSIFRGFLGLTVASLSFSLFADAFVWSGGGTANVDGSRNWSDCANWKVGGKQTESYPSAAADTVEFPAGTICKVRLATQYTIATATMNSSSLSITFVGTDAETCGLTLTTWKTPGEYSMFALDGVSFKSKQDYNPGPANAKIYLRNGAILTVNSFYFTPVKTQMELSGKSKLVATNFRIGNNSTIVLDDSTLQLANSVAVGITAKGGAIVFKGANPKLISNSGSDKFGSELADAGVTLDFEVPVGGFDEAPISCPVGRSVQFFSDAKSAGNLIRILDSSPALRVAATIDQPLVAWSTKGIAKDNVKFGPIETAGSYFEYAAETESPHAWTEAGSFDGTATTLGVHLVGSVHGDRITVSGNPSGFASSAEGWSVGYGDHDGYASGEVTLSAPSVQVYDAEDARGTVTGWKRYVVNPVTRERTLETSGDGSTCTFTFDGAWREVEWQWAVEYRVSVTVNDAEKGGVSVSESWVASGDSVTVTATPAEGFGFTRWTGDVDLSACLDPTISVKGDVAKNLCAKFGKTYYVATDGNDATENGTDPLTPYKTINAALAKAVDYDKIMVAAGKYSEGKTWELNKAVVIAGVGSSQTIVSGCKFKPNNADLVAADLRITGWGSAGAVEFVKAGAGGTLVRCDVSGNTRTSTDGTGIICYVGNIIDCTVTNNVNGSGGNGVGIIVCGGPTRIEGTLIADNDTGYGGTSGGLGITYNTTPSEWTKVSHCTIVRNRGGSTGGLNLSGNNQNVEIVDTIISDNLKYTDPTAANSPDCILGWANGYRRVIRNCIIGQMPTHSAGYEISDCLENLSGGLLNAWEGDFRIGRNSAAWKAATDGTDIGWYQTEPATGLDCGVSAETNWGYTNVATTVHAKVVNAPDGEITYSWDFDNDGSFEIEGTGDSFAAQSHSFDKVGMNAVTLKVAVGGESVTRRVENVVYVAPPVTYIWTQSPNPTFPYATWETASHNPVDAVFTIPAGGRMQFTNEQVKIAKTIRVTRAITVAGTGRENQSNNSTVVPSTGTLVQRTSGDVVNFRIYNTGALVHSMAIGPGRPNVVCIYGDSCVSNCVIRNGEYTSGTATGLDVSYGLVTHCVISNNATGGNNSGGGTVVLANGARLLNSYLTGARHTSSSGTGTRGTVYANAGCTVANCTIVGNTAGTGAGLYTTGKAFVYNNIIRDNSALVSNPDWYDATGTGIYVNNCMPTAHNDGDGTVTDDPAFLPGTITFESGSPCANVGTNLDWMTEGSIDLFGNKRVSGERVDIGCFEADSEKADCDIKAEPSSVVGAVPVTLTAIVTGVSLDGKIVAYDWYLGDAETPFAAGESVNYTFPGGAHDIRLVVTVDGEVMFDKTKPSSVTVYSQDVYLATENANAKFPYGTRETAATDFTAALEATPEGGTLHVMAGRHNVNKCIALSKEITIAADEGLATRPTLLRTASATDSGMFIRLGHEKALVTGLVIDDNKQYSQTVSIGSGTFSDCVISNAYYTSGTGIALDMSGGLCDRCEIVKCSGSDASTTAYGMDVTLTGSAVLRNSLVHQCWSSGKGVRPGVIYVGGSATMENCTIVSNTCSSYSVVYVGGKATVRNNIIWGNDYAVLPGKGGEGGPDWLVLSDATPTLSNNCSPVALGVNAVTADPKFRVRKGRRYCLSSDSPCIEAAAPCAWMEEPGAADFYGNLRRYNAKPDIGCVESQVGGVLLLVK